MPCWKRRCEAWLGSLLLGGCVMAAPAPAPATASADFGLPAALLQAVLADADQRHPGGAPARLQQAQAVTWRNGALGCPQPGRVYTEALVPGWRLLVATDEGALAYHASRQGGWRFCPSGQEEAPTPDPRAY